MMGLGEDRLKEPSMKFLGQGSNFKHAVKWQSTEPQVNILTQICLYKDWLLGITALRYVCVLFLHQGSYQAEMRLSMLFLQVLCFQSSLLSSSSFTLSLILGRPQSPSSMDSAA